MKKEFIKELKKRLEEGVNLCSVVNYCPKGLENKSCSECYRYGEDKLEQLIKELEADNEIY